MLKIIRLKEKGTEDRSEGEGKRKFLPETGIEKIDMDVFQMTNMKNEGYIF